MILTDVLAGTDISIEPIDEWWASGIADKDDPCKAGIDLLCKIFEEQGWKVLTRNDLGATVSSPYDEFTFGFVANGFEPEEMDAWSWSTDSHTTIPTGTFCVYGTWVLL